MKLLYLAEFLVNVSRGLFSLALGKLLYDDTGSLWAFSLVFFLEFATALAVQGYAGSLVDKHGNKKVLLPCLFFSAAVIFILLLVTPSEIIAVYLIGLSVLLSLTKPFIRTATFTLIPSIVSQDRIFKTNSVISIAFQSGQVTGMLVAGILLPLITDSELISIVGVGFFLAGLCYLRIFGEHHDIGKKITRSLNKTKAMGTWRQTFEYIAKNPAMISVYLLTALDFAAIALFNLLLAPVVKYNFDNVYIWLTFLDVGFACGAIMGGIICTKVQFKSDSALKASFATCFFSVLTFIAYAYQFSSFSVIGLIISFGMFNAFSTVSWSSILQKNSPQNIGGRLASLRFVTNSIVVATVTFIVSFYEDQSFYMAALASAILITLLLTSAIVINYCKDNLNFKSILAT